MQSTRTLLPPAGRGEQLARWGLEDDARRVGPAERAGRSPEDVEFLQAGGWTVASVKDGEGGLTSHRGVLHPDEHVDHERLVDMVERELGFTFEEVRGVYRQGRLSDDQRGLRGRIDARLLALSRAGANMLLLARVLGLRVKPATAKRGETCDTLSSALRRARAAEGAS